MAITKTKKPYEFLARWDDAGNLKGSHVIFREAVLDAGVEISSKIGDASPVGIAGFPLLDILTVIQSDALATAATKTAELTALTAEKAAIVTVCDAAEAKVLTLTAQVESLAALQEQVQTLTAAKATAVAAQASTAEQAAALTAAMQVLTTEKATAVAHKDTAEADKAAAEAAKVIAETAKTTAEAARDAALAKVAELEAAMLPPVDSFSRKAIKIALSDAGLLDAFDILVADPQDSAQKLAMISWQEDDMFTKTSPVLVLTFDRMQLTEEQIATLFASAK